MNRRLVPLLLIFTFVAACGASAREQALRTTFAATKAAQAGFEEWDREYQAAIARTATSIAAGEAELAAYKAKRAPVLVAFEAVYRVLAGAAFANDNAENVVLFATAALDRLKRELSTLTGGRLP